jgi:hypothetical protein
MISMIDNDNDTINGGDQDTAFGTSNWHGKKLYITPLLNRHTHYIHDRYAVG